MRKTLTLTTFLFSLFLLCCKSRDVQLLPPVIVSDSSLAILSTTPTDINAFDINYQVVPGKDLPVFNNVYIYWSTDANFTTVSDSVLLFSSVSTTRMGKYHVDGLKPATAYFTRISGSADNRLYYSTGKRFYSDSLKILNLFGVDTFPININRGVLNNPSFIFTNFTAEQVSTGDTSVRIFIGPYECTVTSDQGYLIAFTVPENIVPDQSYTLRLRKKGLTAESRPLYVLKNLWSEIAPPPVPTGQGYGTNSIGFFGTCQSADKGFMVGGVYDHALGTIDSAHTENSGPFYIQQFDGQTNQWSQILPVNPRVYQSPVCYFYNNSIYLLFGQIFSQKTNNLEPYMWRLDLSSNVWVLMGPLPYASINNPVSFELNGDWYIGMGYDLANLDANSKPLPSKKFWRYSPASDSWTAIADFPGRDQEYPTGFSLGAKGYVFSGSIFAGEAVRVADYSKELWEYDASSNTWKAISLPSNGPVAGEKYSIVSHNGKAYFFTSQIKIYLDHSYGYQLQNAGLEFNPSDGSFSPVANNSSAGIMKLIYSKENSYYFQSDALGFIDELPNKTNKLVFDQ